jgi:hypothetical protein
MIDRVTIALIPCTVILSACSIISTTWTKADPQNDSVSGWDIVGVIGAALALYAITRLTVTGILGYYQKTFTLFDTGLYGWAILGALFLGFLIRPPLTRLRQRYPQIALDSRAFLLELYGRFTAHRMKGENRAETTTEIKPDARMISTTVPTPVKLRRSASAQTSTSGKRRSHPRNRKRQSTRR